LCSTNAIFCLKCTRNPDLLAAEGAGPLEGVNRKERRRGEGRGKDGTGGDKKEIGVTKHRTTCTACTALLVDTNGG